MKPDWITCTGGGQPLNVAQKETKKEPKLTRRSLFVAASLGAISWLSEKSALAQVALNPARESDQVLVVIFLRGGADGLNVVVPYAEDNYYRLRPSLAIASPKDKTVNPKERAIDLNGFFGIHPAMAPMLDLYTGQWLSFVHACGSFDHTHSHFDAMSTMERGLATGAGSVSSGWLARYLSTTPAAAKSPLRAVAFGDVLPDSLRGADGAVAMDTLGDFRLAAPDAEKEGFFMALSKEYGKDKDAVSTAGRQTLQALKTINALDPKTIQEGAPGYPKSDLGSGLSQVAMLVKAGVGLEVACLDKGGWDTHVAQGNSTGWQASLMDDLSRSLSAFAADLGPRLKNVTTIVMTEFGRRAYENSGLGTDHGSASFMIVMGGGTIGGKVFGQWPGLEDNQLFGPGDLKVTTDYRNVLAEVLTRRMGVTNFDGVFPGLDYKWLGPVLLNQALSS